MTLAIGQRRTERAPRRWAFTLIELILVLAMLTIVSALAAPSLAGFFRGRALHSEARQLLSLTHAGQSRAVATGFPMLLWIDAREHTYGLQEEGKIRGGNADEIDPKADEFAFNESMEIEAVDATLVNVNGQSLPVIRFLPDGTADENSPPRVRLMAANGDTLWLVQSTNRLTYEIRTSDR